MEFHDVTFILCHFQMENANEDPAQHPTSQQLLHDLHQRKLFTSSTLR